MTSPRCHTLYTIGSSNRSENEFIAMLTGHGITEVIDVRPTTGSRTLHFDECRFGNLSAMLTRHGIVYDSTLQLDLSGCRLGRPTLGAFRRYTATDDFDAGLMSLRITVRANTTGSTAIMCYERSHKQCHRRIIGDAIERSGWTVVHL
ncbi:DUF488 family protein [Mycolicibacterium llatzerense]|uniref:DUF488 domain-containing protein n=1 Tax=Mycolicibacterium llatzerense TaxID=280871 RepID=UPI0013A6FF5C|nr:DUF488 domain-containing protein [Mycolicibacterium llatzerense]